MEVQLAARNDGMPPEALAPDGRAEFRSSLRESVSSIRALASSRGARGRDGGAITSVLVSADGGATWNDADVDRGQTPFSWVAWRYVWTPTTPGRYELACRARDAAGNEQPLDPPWNLAGYANNAVQRVPVTVRDPRPQRDAG
ncbi:MAG: hypothetical protein M3322_04945 [Actinomycetota bacterium]|nr:hypothetical protein [Actinomycetota bacterium]